MEYQPTLAEYQKRLQSWHSIGVWRHLLSFAHHPNYKQDLFEAIYSELYGWDWKENYASER